jgi:hypothetical protein
LYIEFGAAVRVNVGEAVKAGTVGAEVGALDGLVLGFVVGMSCTPAVGEAVKLCTLGESVTT